MALTIDLEAGLRPPPPEQGTPDGRLLFRRQLGQGAEGKVFVAVPTRRPQQHQQQSLLGPTSPTSSSASDDVAQSYPRQQPPRRQVAVKVMSGQAYERCRATRSLWPGLVHPNIVFPRKGCFDDTNGRCFVEMELCETDLLDMVVRGGALRDSRASVFAGQLASALQHLHGQGIAHRDVKLENVFVRDGAAKLGDLGSIAQVPPPTKVPASCQQQHHDEHDHNHIDDDSIRNNNTSINKAAAIVPSSSASSSSKATCSFVGSAMYAPPEAVRRGRGNSNSGAAVRIAGACQSRSSSSSSSGAASRPPSYSRHDPFAGDVWALGVTLWSAKARSHPWEMACVDRSKEFRRFVRKGAEAVFPDNFSPGFRSLLSRLLSLDPLQRPTASEILATPWVTAPPPPPGEVTDAAAGAATANAARDDRAQDTPATDASLSPEGSTGSISGQASCWANTCESSPGRGQPAPVTPTGPESVGLDAGRFDRGYSRAGVGSPSAKVGVEVGVKGNVKVEERETEREMGAGVRREDIDVSPIPVKIGHHHNHNPHISYHHRHHQQHRYEHGLMTVTAPVVPRGEKRWSSPPPTVGACGDGFDASPPAVKVFSPEMSALGSILGAGRSGGSSSVNSSSSSSGNIDSGDGDGGMMEYRQQKIARVTPSPLTLPELAESVEAAGGRGGGEGTVVHQEKVIDFVEAVAPQQGATRILKRPVPASAPDYCPGGEKEVGFLRQQQQQQHETGEHERKPRPCKKTKSRLDDGVGCSGVCPATTAGVTAMASCARISFTLGERGE